METASHSEHVLGSLVEIKLPAARADMFPPCFRQMERIERTFSRFLDDSELARLNSLLGVWQSASDELLSLVEQAEAFRARTGGHFDIALKSVLDDLGYDKNYSFKPKPGASIPAPARASTSPAISLAPSADFSGLPGLSSPRPLIDRPNGRILIYEEIEFGGLGKGYALDRVAALLERHGVLRYYINAGGDIYAKQGKARAEKTGGWSARPDLRLAQGRETGPSGEDLPPWVILLEHPDDPSRSIGKINLDGRAIAASAPNRRKWGPYHHLINAQTKKPAQGAKAIFVLANSGIEADAYATALFTAGFEEGIALSKNLPVEILFISSQDKMYKSKGFDAEMFCD